MELGCADTPNSQTNSFFELNQKQTAGHCILVLRGFLDFSFDSSVYCLL